MREQIEVVYENGVLRPLAPLPARIREHQRLTVTVEGADDPADGMDPGDAGVSLEAVRRALARIPGSLTRTVSAGREDR